MKILSIVNRKGGVGKTTTAINISHELQRLGYKVLMIDLDSQCDLTKIYWPERKAKRIIKGNEKAEKEITIFEVLDGKNSVKSAYRKISDNLYLIPGSKELDHYDKKWNSKILKKELKNKKLKKFDFVIIDHPSHISHATITGLIASHGVVIVAEPDSFSLNNLNGLLVDLKAIKTNMNPELEVIGIFLNKVDLRRNITKHILKELARVFPEEMLINYISVDTAIPNSINKRIPIRELPWRSKTVTQFQQLLDEIVGRMN